MATLRQIASCIGLNGSGRLSVNRDLFGFIRGRIPTDPQQSVVAQVSLLEFVRLMQGRHFHINVIRVGIDKFSSEEIDDIDYAVYKCRNIYKRRNLGLGRVQHFDVNSAQSDGLWIVSSQDDARELTQDWTIPNDAIDVFFPHSITASFVGLSPVGGPCDKDAKGMNGAVADKVRGPERTARTFAHEVGHYFGLGHRNGSPNNLMAQTSVASNARTSVELTSGQGTTIRGHCSVDDGC